MKGPLGHLIGDVGVDNRFLPKVGHRKRSNLYEEAYAFGMDDGWRFMSDASTARARLQTLFEQDIDSRMVDAYRQGFLDGASLLKTAGKAFTPAEQRQLIEEGGRARNADKMNLDGTHYDGDSVAVQDASLFF